MTAIRRTFLHSLFGLTSKNSTKNNAKNAGGPLANRRARFRPSTASVNVANANANAVGPRRVRIRRIPSAASKEQQQRPMVPKLPPAGPALLPKPLQIRPPTTTSGTGSGGVGTTGIAGNSGQAAASAAANSSTSSQTGGGSSFWTTQSILNFLKLNGPVLLLNFGSLCTLAGFTRTDVLELRVGNLIGNCCGMTYFLINKLIPPFTWASVFGMTNAYNIHLILEERSDRVSLSGEEQSMYEEHFLVHGVTPKQFRRMLDRSTVVTIPKDHILVRANQQLDSVYLVVSGKTEASILGRHLTYASSLPGNKVRQKGGDSGAWIGEVQFLEQFWKKETELQRRSTKKSFLSKTKEEEEEDGDVADDTMDDDDYDEDLDDMDAFRGGSRALHTIVCTEDAVLRKWSHDDLEALLKISSDMRSAMTRAMTAAIVGKVVNFTVSRGKERQRDKEGTPT